MELTVNVKLGGISTARKAAEVANRMGGYRAQVLLRRGDVTVNAKSLMGLLSLGLGDDVGGPSSPGARTRRRPSACSASCWGLDSRAGIAYNSSDIRQ